jgi:L-rhamnose-H+ transport protein
MSAGFALILVAAVFQGSFVLPMTLTRKWQWEHTWLTFSVLGMLVFNRALALMTLPSLVAIFSKVRIIDAALLCVFGLGWGAGALLFGLSMDRLGMSLGYPVILGMAACLGTLNPMTIFFPATLMVPKGLLTLGGTALAIRGIMMISRADSRRQPAEARTPEHKTANLRTGLVMALLAGALSCLPNLRIAFGGPLVTAARVSGASSAAAPNAVWLIFLRLGAYSIAHFASAK